MKHKILGTVGLVFISMALTACDKAVPPEDAAVPAVADDASAAPPTEVAPPVAGTPLDKIENKLEKPAFGSVDALGNVPAPKSGAVVPVTGKSFEIAGFAVDETNATAAAGVVILVDGRPYVATYGGDRPDIATTLNNANYTKSQFWAEIPTESLAKGAHEVTFRVIASDLSGYYQSDWTATVSVE